MIELSASASQYSTIIRLKIYSYDDFTANPDGESMRRGAVGLDKAGRGEYYACVGGGRGIRDGK